MSTFKLEFTPPTVSANALAAANKRTGDTDPEVQLIARELVAVAKQLRELPRQIEEAARRAGGARQ